MLKPTPASRTSRLRLSVTWRLTLWYGGSILVLLVISATILLTALHWNQHAVLHQRLFGVQSALLPEVVIGDDGPYFDVPLEDREGTLQLHEPLGTFARLLTVDGIVQDRSPNWDDRTGFTPAMPAEAAFVEVQLQWNDHPVRAAYAPIEHHGRLVGWLEVSGLAWQPRHQPVGWPIHGALAGTLLLALGGGYVLAKHALKPVVRLTEAAQSLSASDLDVRVPVKGLFNDEMTDLTAVFNAMLARLEAAFAREKRFTANAAHELMNPLASIRSQAEITLRRPRTPTDYEATLQTILEEVQRLSACTEHLLHLARLEEAVLEDSEPLEVTMLLKDRLAYWQTQATQHHQMLTVDVPTDMWVRIESTHLLLILDNLLDNAIKYTPPMGTIDVVVDQEDNLMRLSVTDTGVGFDASTHDHLFDRFFRATHEAVQQQSGAGLGLAVTQAVVAAYRGQIKASSAGIGYGSRFTVTLPVT